jgi:hypothetical protein
MDPGDTFTSLGAALARDGAELQATIEALAERLTRALPGATEVRWSGGGLLGRGERRVRGLEVEVGAARFALELEDGNVVAWRQREVGGVAIKRVKVTPDEWIAELTADLRTEAARNAEARSALHELLG